MMGSRGVNLVGRSAPKSRLVGSERPSRILLLLGAALALATLSVSEAGGGIVGMAESAFGFWSCGAADRIEFVARLEYLAWVELVYGLIVGGPEVE